MRLRLNLCDVEFQLIIKNWRKAKDPYDDLWTDEELTLKSEYINYKAEGELLMFTEVEYLEEVLGALIDGTLSDDARVAFAEPDIEFDLRIAKRLYDIPGKVIYRKGYEDVDIDADLIINFWCKDGLGGNSFSMALDREDIFAVHKYLQLIVGKLNKDDKEIQTLIEKGLLLSD